MEQKRRELSEILLDIRKEIPGFDKEELLEYTRWAILNLYDELRADTIQQNKVKCKEGLIHKILENKEKYRITKNIDHMSVQYVELFECEKENGETHVKVYISLIFYDNVNNNIANPEVGEKYWNDIWIITYREAESNKRYDANCVNCGAVMEYNEATKIFNCDYCGNVITTEKWNRNWEIVDIEVEQE